MYIYFQCQWIYTDAPSIISHSATKECTEADVAVTIQDPNLSDLFQNKTGTIKCHVKVNKPSVSKIYWEDGNGNPIAGASMAPNGNKRETTHSLPLGITYDEWNEGIKLNCVVEHSDLILPITTSYERKTGKTIELLSTKD